MNIRPEDIKVDLYLCSTFSGFAHTAVGVSITHLPTMMEVRCCTETSQHRNTAKAMAMLRESLECMEHNADKAYEHLKALDREYAKLTNKIEAISKASEFVENLVVIGH